MATRSLSSLLTLGLGGGGRRYVLTVGEEFTVLTLLSGARVDNAWIVPAEPEEGTAEIRAVLQKDRKAPVTLLADTFEQIYKEEAVPRVGRLDQGKVVRRHSAQAVPGDMWQGALAQGQDPRGAKLFYLFCGLPRTDHVAGWVTFYESLPNPRRGIHLLPLESLALMNALFDAEAKSQGGVRWRIMTTMNVTGGLRQIVAKQGRMMLTRLTPAPPEDMEPHEAAAMMARDFRQTLTYVKRMGYREGDALDLALIVDPALGEALRTTQWDAQSVLVTTPHEVGRRLGLGSVGKADQPFGDVLHAAWFATRKAHTLALVRPSEQKSDWHKQLEKAAPLAAVAAVGGVLYGSWMTGDGLWTTWDSITRLGERITVATSARDAAQAERDALPYDPDVMRGTLALADELQSGALAVMPLVQALADGLRNRAYIRVFELENAAAAPPPDPLQAGRGGGDAADAGRPTFAWRADLDLVLIDVATAEDALALGEKLLADLRAAAPGVTVTLLRPPVAVLPDQTLVARVAMDRQGTGTPTAGLAAPPAAVTTEVADPGSGGSGGGGGGAGGTAAAGFTMRIALVKETAP
ncbi:hypothetical protein [Caenispirillum bisanense]|uniref:hypothetical protein n=1 Tax=Caenispirillum bisanense TaxID=414052 RepID=UPI0031DA9CD9